MSIITKRILFLFAFTAALFITGCEDEAAEEENALVSDSFNISRVDVKSTGDDTQSQPELIRFINSTEGVIVNSKQNTVDFFTISPTEITITGESINITDSDDAECSSIDVSVDESVLAVVVTKGSCETGELLSLIHI